MTGQILSGGANKIPGPQELPVADEYWRGRNDERKEHTAREEHSIAEEKARELIANRKLSVEFSDSVVVIRDGLDRPIHRCTIEGSLNSDRRTSGAEGNWKGALAEEMARRNCTNIGCRMSENLLITILSEYRRRRDRIQETAAPSAPFEIEKREF